MIDKKELEKAVEITNEEWELHYNNYPDDESSEGYKLVRDSFKMVLDLAQSYLDKKLVESMSEAEIEKMIKEFVYNIHNQAQNHVLYNPSKKIAKALTGHIAKKDWVSKEAHEASLRAVDKVRAKDYLRIKELEAMLAKKEAKPLEHIDGDNCPACKDRLDKMVKGWKVPELTREDIIDILDRPCYAHYNLTYTIKCSIADAILAQKEN